MKSTRAPRSATPVILAVGLLVATVSVALAGTKTTRTVTVDTTNLWAYGSMGDARASSDTKQYIGCNMEGYTTEGLAYCEARNSAGQSIYCLGWDASIVQAAAAVSPGSYVWFSWDASGTCTQINAVNNSQYRTVSP